MAPLEGSEQLGRQLTAHELADLIVSADSSTRAATSDQRNRARSRLMAALIPSMSWSPYRGHTNRKAGELLFISPKTVGRHVEIYAKIGVSTRVGATAYAIEHRLLG